MTAFDLAATAYRNAVQAVEAKQGELLKARGHGLTDLAAQCRADLERLIRAVDAAKAAMTAEAMRERQHTPGLFESFERPAHRLPRRRGRVVT